MKVFPLTSLTLAQAQQKQFALMDVLSRHFTGSSFLNLGDLGLHPQYNHPQTTRKIEQVIAEFFHAEDALLVQGAGTGALRYGLAALLKAGETILVHDAPIYPTTQVNIEQMGLNIIRCDYNQLDVLKKTLESQSIDAALIQHTRQKPDDAYRLSDVIECIKTANIPTLIDDNYAVLKVQEIGCELGATLSTFSSFKLFGPSGVGVVVGQQSAIDNIRKTLYSGGCQIQGFQAIEVLQGLVFAPVMHATQAQVNDELLERLNQKELPFVKSAVLANAQSKVLLVEFNEPIAAQLLIEAEKKGALPYPVGAESKYELLPLFYRLSGTFRQNQPELTKKMIRINPNRCGADTVIRILQQSYQALVK